MFYKFTILKSNETSHADFENALYCSTQSVKSILDTCNLTITLNSPSIYISKQDEVVMPFSLCKCRDLIQGSFVDLNHRLYPEFASIRKETAIQKN